jgi:hypothetical protein
MLEHPNERIVILYLSFIFRKWKEVEDSPPPPPPPARNEEADRLREELGNSIGEIL